MEKSDKGFVPVLLLCLFFGVLGIHAFYAGRIVKGILMLITLGGFGIWTLIDLIMIATQNFEDKQGRKIKAS